jgi:hypothetical protein
MKKLTLTLALLTAFSVFGQSAPSTPVAPTAPTPAPMIAVTDTAFSAGVTTALNQATTNIVYLQQSGNTPTVNILQDGNSNRSGASASGTINSMILQGDNQTVTIIQQGNGNLVDTLQLVTTAGASQVTIQQIGNENSINAICGGGSANCNNANINWAFSGNSNTLNYTGSGNSLISGINVNGNGNSITDLQQGPTTGSGHQQLITVTGDNNTYNITQTASVASSIVNNQVGTGTSFNFSQTGSYGGVINVQSQANGGSITISQHGH